MFGVTGDLARKKLMPAIYDLANRGLLPPGFSFVGFARRDWEDEDFAQVTYQAVKEHARTPFRDAVWEQLSEGVRFVSGSFDDDAAFDELAETVQAAGRRARHRRELRVLPVDPAEPVPHRGASSSSAAACPTPQRPRLAAGGDREAVRPRPGQRPGAERDPGRGLPAGRGVPHRPLPGQGDRPEHPRAALRQRDVRADLEPRLRRSRADHHGRGHRHRRPGRLLRRHRRRPRRDPEPPAAAAGADRDGGAGRVRRGLAADGEGEGAFRGPAARRPRDRHRARAVRGRLAGRPAGASASWRRTASRRIPAPRRTPRCGSASTPGAGPGCRSTCGRASGCRAG